MRRQQQLDLGLKLNAGAHLDLTSLSLKVLIWTPVGLGAEVHQHQAGELIVGAHQLWLLQPLPRPPILAALTLSLAADKPPGGARQLQDLLLLPEYLSQSFN